MVGKLALNLTPCERGWIMCVPGGAIFVPSTPKTGKFCIISPAHSLNESDGVRNRGNFGMRSHASHRKGDGINMSFSPGIMPSYMRGIGERIAQLPSDVSP